MTAVKLAPCPFCGRQPRVRSSEFAMTGRGFKVECWAEPNTRCQGHGVDVHGPTEEAAAKSWNRAFSRGDHLLRELRAGFAAVRRRWRKELGADPFGFAEVARLLNKRRRRG